MTIKNQQSEYHVSFNTFVLQPIVKEERMLTRIIEQDQLLTVPRKPLHILRKACIDSGKTFEVATNSSKLFLNKRHKLPIIAAHDYGMPLIFLPTMASSSEHNIWIALHAIENFEGDNMGCTVYLANDHTVKINVSEATINRQHTLGSLLEKNFHKKQRQLNGNLPLGTMQNYFLPLRSKL